MKNAKTRILHFWLTLIILLNLVAAVPGLAYCDPGVQRWISRDPLGEVGGPNLFSFCRNDSINADDAYGLDTYKCNRKLGGDKALGLNDNVSHTFVFTTNPDGAVRNTYSWGNSANSKGWNRDQPEDIKAAKEALGKGSGYARKVGDSTLDPYVERAYNDLNQKRNEHPNLGVVWNCKSEADSLIEQARRTRPPPAPVVFYSGAGGINAPPTVVITPK